MSASKSVTLPNHLWDTLDVMSSEMGVAPDGLLAQAVFTLARLNGYVVPGTPKVAASVVSRAPAAPARVSAPPAPKAAHESQLLPEDSGSGLIDNAHARNQLDDSNEQLPSDDDASDFNAEPVQSQARSGGRFALTLFVTGRDPYKMSQESFTIGRGKTCDFVIESNRVSREHCRIAKEGNDYVLEDLNSSNGTFFGPQKEKISRRKIKDGDEFTLGTEKIRFQIRK